MFKRLKLKAMFASLAMIMAFNSASAEGAMCEARFVNPFTDICWSCLFPMTVGKVPVIPSSKGLPDTYNPTSPICECPMPAPIFVRFGLSLGYWEPFALTDITRVPYCMVNMGFQMTVGHKSQEIGGLSSFAEATASNPTFMWVHWYKYPVVYWLELIMNMACVSAGSFDIAYLAEIDPMWDDDELSFILNPEAILFGNPITQLACIADAVKTSGGYSLPIDALFWCAGSHGSMYPFTGTVGHSFSNVSNAVLVNERMNFKLHREGLIPESEPEIPAMCWQHYQPILPKSRYRYQFTNVIPEPNTCHPYGATTMLSEAGRDNPVTGMNFGILNWRKRNCCFM